MKNILKALGVIGLILFATTACEEEYFDLNHTYQYDSTIVHQHHYDSIIVYEHLYDSIITFVYDSTYHEIITYQIVDFDVTQKVLYNAIDEPYAVQITIYSVMPDGSREEKSQFIIPYGESIYMAKKEKENGYDLIFYRESGATEGYQEGEDDYENKLFIRQPQDGNNAIVQMRPAQECNGFYFTAYTQESQAPEEQLFCLPSYEFADEPVIVNGDTIGFSFTIYNDTDFDGQGDIQVYEHIIKHGEDGADGRDGANGQDGQNATMDINYEYDEEGNAVLYITTTDAQGTKTVTIELRRGQDGADGSDGRDGVDGADGETPMFDINYEYNEEGNVVVHITVKQGGVEKTYDLIIPKGEKGEPGVDGQDGYNGRDGVDGQDGRDGEDGHINVYTIQTCQTNEGTNVTIVSIWLDVDDSKTYTEGDQFQARYTIRDGADGADGADGQDGEDAETDGDHWSTYAWTEDFNVGNSNDDDKEGFEVHNMSTSDHALHGLYHNADTGYYLTPWMPGSDDAYRLSFRYGGKKNHKVNIYTKENDQWRWLACIDMKGDDDFDRYDIDDYKYFGIYINQTNHDHISRFKIEVINVDERGHYSPNKDFRLDNLQILLRDQYGIVE